MIYSNKDIIEQIKDEKYKKLAEFFDSKGVIIIEYNDTKGPFGDGYLSILSTKKEILKIKFDWQSKNFINIENNTHLVNIYIYNNEENLELLIDSKCNNNYIIGKYCKKINFKSYEDYCNLYKILVDKYSTYDLIDINARTLNNENKVVVKLRLVKNNISSNKDKYLYLIFDANNFDTYETSDIEPKSAKLKVVPAMSSFNIENKIKEEQSFDFDK